MLETKIQQDIIAALKNKDEKKLSCLRFLAAQIKNKQIDSKTKLTDNDIISIIRKQIKELKEANALFEKGGRKELVEKNKFEINLLLSYLPTEISDEQLQNEIKKIIANNQEIYNKNKRAVVGIAIKTLKEKVSPDRIIKLLNEMGH